ncbi:MAG: sigma-54-dependent Fis family transcriptional regulator [Gammaproteobacteria bacterium]|nr:sigma-54-dependent Fis family transcriptional regulator [Gammaproteobacteria bacterium]NVK87514.1 sigma-54-dependent Fis family transcriptional regulator [Gammaproteobacteria bacterium]
MKNTRVLLIDDEPDILELLSITLIRMGIDCDTAASVTEAKSRITKTPYQLCLTDMKLPDGSGLDIVDFFIEQQPNVPIAVITAHGNMQTAIEAMKRGAFDFISKPVDLANLRAIINSALMVSTDSLPPSEGDGTVKNLIGSTPEVEQLKLLIQKVAKSQAPVYIKGESGTGKELVARLIHQNSPRRGNSFVAINCGAIPTELMESEFFGHKKGAFTGATNEKEGLFMAANGGTLFLDEIADLPLPMQVKLLRAIQERSVRPVGSEKEVPVNVRLLSASHKNLAELVSQNQFRQDLFYRINVIEINVPSLRQRSGDIPALTHHFIELLANRNGTPIPQIDNDAVQRLEDYHFPGNIRELENILERAMTLSADNKITSSDIFLPTGEGHNLAMESLSDRSTTPLDDYLEAIEKREILLALEQTHGNKTQAAELLGISFRAMRYKCKKLNIDD